MIRATISQPVQNTQESQEFLSRIAISKQPFDRKKNVIINYNYFYFIRAKD